MRLILNCLALFVIAAVVGVGLTAVAVRHPPAFSAVRVGPWTSEPTDQNLGGDPYALAHVATSGELPLARGDGITLTATTDDRGHTLRGTCTYRVSGTVPAARVWTLAVQTEAGGVFANPAERYGFASSEVMRTAAGAVAIAIGPHARPGDWIPTGAAPFVLKLRLYDTTIGDSAARLEGALPAISRTGCS